MRILMLSPHSTVQGPLPKHTPLLVEALRAAGCDVTSEPWGRHTDAESLSKKIFGRFVDVLRIRSLVSPTRFEVVVVKTSHEWLSLLRDVPLLLALRSRVRRIVVQFHGGRSDRLVKPGNWMFKSMSLLLFRLADGVFVLSTEEANAAASFYRRGRFMTVVNPFVATEPEGAVRRRPELPSVPTLLFASRLVAEKGVFETLEAFALLCARRRCRLVIAGDGPASAAVGERARELGVTAGVTLTGQLERDELAKAYREADVFVLPTFWVEGFPTVIAEAMDAGLPVITIRSRGMADHLSDGVNAIFVAPHAPAELADAIDRVLSDETLRRTMSAENRCKVQEFRPEAAARTYLRALELIDGFAEGVVE